MRWNSESKLGNIVRKHNYLKRIFQVEFFTSDKIAVILFVARQATTRGTNSIVQFTHCQIVLILIN